MSIHELMSGRLLRFALVAASVPVLVLGAAACGGDDDDDDGNGATTAPATATTSSNGNGDGNGNGNGNGGGEVIEDAVTISMIDNAFEPKDITVKANTDVEITVENDGAAVHNMHVLSADKEGEDFKSDALVNPGQSSTFTVNFSTTGEFDFQCDYHLPDMVGTITVVD